MYNTGKIEGIKGLPRLEALEVEESEEDRYVFWKDIGFLAESQIYTYSRLLLFSSFLDE